MPTTETASPPTSELVFLSWDGTRRPTPQEWSPALLLVPAEIDQLGAVTVTVNGDPQGLSVRVIDGRPSVVAEWERSGPGWYTVDIDVAGALNRHRVKIDPAKISSGALATLLHDLEVRLPITIAVALRDAGAHIGVNLASPAEQTLATEVARLRKAVRGVPGRPGLVRVLHALANDPHRMLEKVGEWVKARDARRPDPSGLVQALWRAGNLEKRTPVRVLDQRVEHTVDLYENRIVKAFETEVERRLRRVIGVLSTMESQQTLHAEVSEMLAELLVARRAAGFLDDVSRLRASPSKVTMVLTKRREYRAAFEGFLDFRRRMTVHLDEPLLSEPLRGLPHLYQLWGALLVIEATLSAASRAGYRVVHQRLVWPQAGGFYLRPLHDNRPALVLRKGQGERLRLYHERTYSPGGSPIGSISFTQRPDIALELVRADGRREVTVFDPKYKLDSDSGETGDGRPKKDDIDKMHAYRDAIRGSDGTHVVRSAAILYPGRTETFGSELTALRMYPGEEARLVSRLGRDLEEWLVSV